MARYKIFIPSEPYSTEGSFIETQDIFEVLKLKGLPESRLKPKYRRSAYWMKQGKLPVYAFDLHRHASFLAYTVNYDQLHVLESLEMPND